MEDDWLSFDSSQAATAYSKMLSEQIGDRRAAHQQKLKEQEEQLKAEEDSASPTPALLPEEVIARYHGVMDLLREVGDSENSADNIHQVISWIENEENLFNRERGIYGGLDLGRPFPSKTEKDKEGKPIDLTLLQQLESRRCRHGLSIRWTGMDMAGRNKVKQFSRLQADRSQIMIGPCS